MFTRYTEAVQKVQLRIKWADNFKGPASLKVDNYAHGEDAAFDSNGCCWFARKMRRQPRTRDVESRCTLAGPVADIAVITGCNVVTGVITL